MFLGKYRFYIPATDTPGYSTDGWASYQPSGGLEPPERWCPWYTYNFVDGKKVGPYPPGKETNIALIAREDKQLCFQLSNGSYVKYVFDFQFVDTLDQATGFAFPDRDDILDPPPPFNSHIQTVTDGGLLCLAEGGQVLLSGCDQQFSIEFTVSQVTSWLQALDSSKNGDGMDFSWVDLSECFFDRISLVKADFSHCNLTNAIFSGCNLTNAILTNANLLQAQFMSCTLDGALLDNCNLTATEFERSTLFGTNLEGSTFQGTNLSLAQVAGAIFKHSDLTSAFAYPALQFYNIPLAPPSPANPRTTISNCTLNQSLIGNDWSMLDLTGSTILGLSSPLSSPAKPLKASYAILTSLNKGNFIGLSLESAVFDYAVLDGLALNSSGARITDLSGASFIQASMHETNLSGAILKGANMTGAQLGSLGQLFTLATSFVADLNSGSTVDAALRDQFTQHGITLSQTATISIQTPNRVWQVDDLGNNAIYIIRLEPTQILTVYATATAASLADAYMPDAVLTGANLYGVLASRAQFYGAAARIDGFAILEGVEFNDANLSNVNFTQAYLYGANLSGAQLFNAKFNSAYLTPSAGGEVTNLIGANLQGANFTGAELYWSNLENAAVAINVPTKANPDQGGVHLFSLPNPHDKHTLQEYIDELNAAATLFSLNPKGDAPTLQKYVTALDTNNVALLKVAFIQHQITLSDAAQVHSVVKDEVWQIVDGTKIYNVWEGPDEDGNMELYVAPSLTNTTAAFELNSITLRYQASAAVDVAGQQWLLDNDSENPHNFSTGYVRFILTLNGNVLDVYGSAVRVERLGDKQQYEMDTENCNVTTLAVTNMNDHTVCPNGTKVSDQPSDESWEQWLRAPKVPLPPTCVPTDYQFCPPPSGTKEKEGSGS